MNRLFRLLPLASLVLTACSIHAPKGPGKSPDSPQWRQHQQDVRNLNQFQTRGALLISPMSKKSMPASSGSKPARTAIACC
jgi:outer membrane lipoprotein LolB